MAQGHIILENGEYYRVRWTGYDAIIEITIQELSHFQGGKDLLLWLKTMIPGSNAHEAGAFFYNAEDHMILRTLDLRGLTKNNRILFWAALEMGAKKLSEFGAPYSDLNPLIMTNILSMHQAAPDNIGIIEEDEKFLMINDDVVEKIGPGWTKK